MAKNACDYEYEWIYVKWMMYDTETYQFGLKRLLAILNNLCPLMALIIQQIFVFVRLMKTNF